jgi:hypothetical protein
MNRIAAFVVALVLPGIGMAADFEGPVKKIMDITALRWKPGSTTDRFYFDPDLMPALYSKDFVEHYQEASHFPALDDGTNNPFDYDVITGGQDGCPLNTITYKVNPAKFGKVRVNVTYTVAPCEGFEIDPKALSHVDFIMIEEDGKPVIDDILRMNAEFKTVSDSLKAEMIVLTNY